MLTRIRRRQLARRPGTEPAVTVADGAVSDHSRHVAAKLVVVGEQADRFQQDFAGHWYTEITPKRRAA